MTAEIFALNPQELNITPELVLRAQGMDPERVKARRPALLKITEKAIATGLDLLAPAAIDKYLVVSRLVHDRLILDGGAYLQGELIASQLAGSEAVIAAVCTVGGRISERITEVFEEDPGLAMALDGMASAAVEVLGNHLCRDFEEQALLEGKKISLPLNPGMIGWPVSQGQPQIFSLLDAAAAGMRLTPECLILPLKSLSFIVGVGHDLENSRQSCDFCTLNKTCQYREPLANAAGIEA